MSLTGWVLQTLSALGRQALRADHHNGLGQSWALGRTGTLSPGACAPVGAAPRFTR